jgi:phage FluMu protein Com
MRNQKRKQVTPQLRKLRCPRCGRWLASVYLPGGAVVEMPCRRCKAMVQGEGGRTTFSEQGLTTEAH